MQVRSSEFLDDLPTQWGRFVEAPTTGAGLSVPQLIVISDGLTPNMDFEALIHDATAHNMTVSAPHVDGRYRPLGARAELLQGVGG